MNLIRIVFKEVKIREASDEAQLLHFFLDTAGKNDIFASLAFTHPKTQISSWMHLRNDRGKAIKEYTNIGLIEIPGFSFSSDSSASTTIEDAKKHYSSFIDAIRADKIDYLIAAAMPNAEKYRDALAETSVQVVTFGQNFERPEDLKVNAIEQLPWLKGKAKAVHSLTWKSDQADIFLLPAMAQKWRSMGAQIAASLNAEAAAETPQYATHFPYKMLSFKAAARAFQLTSDDEKNTQFLSNEDVIYGPWSAISKSSNAMIFRDGTSLMFAGTTSDWQPFKDLPKESNLMEVACVGDCPYWRATFSNLDSQNHPGLITMRRVSTEDGKPAYLFKIHSWINGRGPASVLRDGWVVISLKPAFPEFKTLPRKFLEFKNPTTRKWERYKIKDQDYSAIGAKNRATGLPYIVVQSGAEYRIR